MDSIIRLGQLQRDIREFARQRDWDQFHTPKNISMALTVEAAELMELFQWGPPGGPSEAGFRENVAEELGDILIYLARMADMLKIDLERAAFEKMGKNALRYPVEKARGSCKKYTEL